MDHDVAFRECFAQYLHDYDLLSVESIRRHYTELRYNVHLQQAEKPGEFVVAAIQQINGKTG